MSSTQPLAQVNGGDAVAMEISIRPRSPAGATESSPTDGRMDWVALRPDGLPVGTATVLLPVGPGHDQEAELELSVEATERRRGIGTLLLGVAATGAAARGRSTISAQAHRDSAGDLFLAGSGFQRKLALRYVRLALSEANVSELAADQRRPHPGFRLVAWSGVVPDGLADSVASGRRAMDDMPTGELETPPVRWDADRLRTVARAVEARGEALDTVAVLAGPEGTVAGFTELVVPGDGRGDGLHYGTAVLPEFRGRGLARWMKAEAILRALQRWPQLGGLIADTAEENAGMRAVNDSLGYRETHVVHLYQRGLAG